MKLNLYSRYRGQLMGVSIIGVMLCHWLTNAAAHGITEYSLLQNLLMLGNAYVDAFLFLSGLGLYYSFSSKTSLISFYKRRLIRILVPYVPVALITITFCCIRDARTVVHFFLEFTGISLFLTGKTFAWYIVAIFILYLVFPFIYRYTFDHTSDGCSYLMKDARTYRGGV